jgi:Xaa-Pro dipeptidase
MLSVKTGRFVHSTIHHVWGIRIPMLFRTGLRQLRPTTVVNSELASWMRHITSTRTTSIFCSVQPFPITQRLLSDNYRHTLNTHYTTTMSTMSKYPAKAHAIKVGQNLIRQDASAKHAVIYLRGDVLHERHTTDIELPFRQESNFFYLTGINAPDFHLLYHVADQRLVVFVRKMPDDEIVWHGQPPSLEALNEKYEADGFYYTDELSKILANWQFHSIHVLPNQDLSVLANKKYRIDDTQLLQAITDARIYKDAYEIEQMRIANRISSQAHIKLMQEARMGGNERDLDTLFTYEVTRHGCNGLAYGSIVGAGRHAAVLHYSRNDAPFSADDPTQLVLVDAGGEYNCYAADITRTWPIGGRFSHEGRIIYETVLAMQKAVFDELRPGVQWEELHRKADRVCVKHLLEAGILHKANLDELVRLHLGGLFFPHGLGHLIGLDVHDVGGYPEGVERIPEPGLRYLRMRRPLEENMVVTVEPGCYFIDAILEPALANPELAPYINREVLDRFRPVGGVRIEDCVLITADGFENLTSVPKEISDIQALMTAAHAARLSL